MVCKYTLVLLPLTALLSHSAWAADDDFVFSNAHKPKIISGVDQRMPEREKPDEEPYIRTELEAQEAARNERMQQQGEQLPAGGGQNPLPNNVQPAQNMMTVPIPGGYANSPVNMAVGDGSASYGERAAYASFLNALVQYIWSRPDPGPPISLSGLPEFSQTPAFSSSVRTGGVGSLKASGLTSSGACIHAAGVTAGQAAISCH